MLSIDGTSGGGQILRTSLTLGAILGQSFVINDIRSKRPKPGLQAQHLACVLAVQAITKATIIGGDVGSMELRYEQPTEMGGGTGRPIYPALRDFVFRIGTAGSAMLLLQTVLPILLWSCRERSTFLIEGGTHNDLAPSSSFIEETFLPILLSIGVQVQIITERVGLMPEGNGRVRVVVEPIPTILGSLSLVEPKINGQVTAKLFFKNTSNTTFRDNFSSLISNLEEISCGRAKKPAYAVCIYIETNAKFKMVLSASDFKNNPQNIVEKGTQQLQSYLTSNCVVDEYLSDQLLLYLALGCNIAYRIESMSEHFTTNLQVIHQFFGEKAVIEVDQNLVVNRADVT